MKQTKQFLRPLLMAIVMLVGMLVPQGAWAQSPVTVDGQGFSTIQEAIDNIVGNGWYDATLTLHQDFTLEDDESIDIYFNAYSEDLNFTIDLNGHTITGGCDWDNNSIGFANNGEGLPTVTIANSCQDKKGKLFNCRLDLNENTKVIVNEGVSIYPSFELLNSALYVVSINYETSSVENYGDIYGGVVIMSGGSFINNGSVAYVSGEFENNGSYCAYFNWADDGSSFSAFVNGGIFDYIEGDKDYSITSEVSKEPTCTEPGVRTVTGTFEGFTDTKEVEIPAGHDYQVQNVVWSEDYTSATLQLVCSRDAEHTANVEVTDEGITSEDTTPATCTTAGVRTYTATATYEGEEYTGTKEVEISATGHDYQVQKDENENPVFVWNEDYTSATLQVVCSHNAEHTANVEVTGEDITSAVTTPATCTTAGVRTYTAKATYKDVEYTGTKEVEIPAAGHSFVDGVCEVCHATAVAEVKIGETTTGYTDIQEAFDAAMAATGDVTVKLLADVTLIDGVNNLARGEEANRYDVALTLDLNGHNVTGNNSQAVIYVRSITLNITDEGKTGSINNCRLLVFKSDIYVAEGVTLRAEEWHLTLVDLEEDCSLVNDGNLYGCVIYNAGTTFTNYGSVAYAQNNGGDFENWGSFIPIWRWHPDWETDEYYCEVYMNNEKLYSSQDGNVELSSEVTKAPTCTERGERTYTAAIEYVGKTYTDTYSAYIDIDPDAHSFTSKTLTAGPDEHGLYAYVCDREGCEGHSDYNVVKAGETGEGESTTTIELAADGEGNFSAASVDVADGKTFSTPVAFTVPSNQVTVERTFTAEKPASVMLPFSIGASLVQGAKFYEFKGVKYENNEWVADMSPVVNVEAYKPYLVILDADNATCKVTFGNTSVDVATFAVTPAASTMQTADENGWTFQAVNAAKTWGENDPELGKAYGFAGQNATYDGYSVAQGEFIKVGAGATAAPGRCYLVKEGALAANAKGMRHAAEVLPSTIKVRFINGEATGIATLNTETGEFTLEGWYDLNGRKINAPAKGGIYVKDGKKVLVK